MSLQLDITIWILIGSMAVLVGMTKAGVVNINLPVLPFLVASIGGLQTAGLILPMMIVADVLAILAYRTNIRFEFIKKILPTTVIGLVIGTVFGKYVSSSIFSKTVGIVILICICLMLWQEIKKEKHVTSSVFFSIFIGLLAGFSTMVGNVAGPIMALYLLSVKIPKFEFVGTGAIFFLIVNLTKLPLHVFIWKSISLSSLKINLMFVVLIVLGFLLGKYIVKVIPEIPYRWFIIIVTTLSTIKLFF